MQVNWAGYQQRTTERSSGCGRNLGRLACLAGSVLLLSGCAMSAPMQVLRPARLSVPPATRIAVAPIVASANLASELEAALQVQRQSLVGQVNLLTAKDLVEASPIRMVSMSSLTSDLSAVHAARQARAELLLMGEVVQDELGPPETEARNSSGAPPELAQFNPPSIPLLAPASVQKPQRLAIAWRVFDVPSGRVVGSQTLAIDRMAADREFPDLQYAFPLPRERVIAASARQTWQAVTPYLSKEDVVLALPWLQPGAAQIRRGNAYARIGRWDLAEEQWAEVVEKNPWSNSARHNLSLAQAAREEFSTAKATLKTMGPLRMRRRQSETLVWLDRHQRYYHQALSLPPPAEGWAFPEPVEPSTRPVAASTAPDPEDAPWWTVIPLTKPPGWTWRSWLLQPWAL